MLLKELYKKYDKEYNIVVFGVPLKEMKHCTPFTRLPRDKELMECEVVEYKVEEKPYVERGIHFATMKPTKPINRKGHVYVYVQ